MGAKITGGRIVGPRFYCKNEADTHDNSRSKLAGNKLFTNRPNNQRDETK